jgi:putative SOS response-associated peptidase YedK
VCGRFTQTRSWPELVALYRITEPVSARPPSRRYNIAPTDDVAVVRRAGGGRGRELVTMRWGLVPPWAKDLGVSARMINARAETVTVKPAFRTAFRQHRCLVVADGFYEWQDRAGRAKQPYHIAPADGGLFAFAGLWERWRRDDGEPIDTCTIVTSDAAAALGTIHDRMPVMLSDGDFDVWLDQAADVERARALLRPFTGELTVRPVSRRVNAVRSDDAACVAPLALF